eukprot:353684-Chlamydomonas_euryale.AAC.12
MPQSTAAVREVFWKRWQQREPPRGRRNCPHKSMQTCVFLQSAVCPAVKVVDAHEGAGYVSHRRAVLGHACEHGLLGFAHQSMRAHACT